VAGGEGCEDGGPKRLSCGAGISGPDSVGKGLCEERERLLDSSPCLLCTMTTGKGAVALVLVSCSSSSSVLVVIAVWRLYNHEESVHLSGHMI